MDDKKTESVGDVKCVCQHMSTCQGGMHNYCFKRCCMWKCIIAALVLVAVFCAGHASGREGHRGYFERGYRGDHMMMDGMMQGGSQVNRYYQQAMPTVPAGNQVMMYRTINTTSTTSAVAVPAGTMMIGR